MSVSIRRTDTSARFAMEREHFLLGPLGIEPCKSIVAKSEESGSTFSN